MRVPAANISLLLALSLMTAGWSLSAQSSDTEAPSSYVRGLPDGPGKAEMVRMCSSCHDIEEVGVARLSRKGWGEKVDEMFRAGAVGADRDVALVVDYLFTAFPARLDINTAITMDFRRYLGLSERDGDIIVAYRQQHGPFKRWQDLELVPGIDVKKIRERSEILFVDLSR